ncbi:phage-shock protein [Vibrio tubiashii]|nr:phage-shock protein [Vibrio tubiashii]
MSLTNEQLETVNKMRPDERFNYCIKEIAKQRKVWILTDEHGCVMLNTEDEDCVPVWPHQQFAEQWATGDWEHCKAEPISTAKWFSRWTYGLEDDELSVVVFPNDNEEGMVLYPDEFEAELKKRNA